MNEGLEPIISQLISHPLFLKLKGVVENNPYHDHEDAYTHSIKTKDIALREIEGDFITSPDAKLRYRSFIGEDAQGMMRKDAMILIALLHDIGKGLTVSEAGRSRSILEIRKDGNTACPGHEYWGSTIVADVFKDLYIPFEVIQYITRGVAVHDTFNDSYISAKSTWPIEEIISDVKSRAENQYIEALFTIYCDNYTAEISSPSREIIKKIFDASLLYETRKYSIG